MTEPSELLHSTQPLRGEEEWDRTLRPRNLSEFLGQEALLEPLLVMAEASRRRGEPLEHLLLAGMPGLGKTSLAHALASEFERPIRITSGPALERPKDLVGILSALEEGSILFIDEIHRVPRVVEEYLYGGMEDFKVEFTLDQGTAARILELAIQPFTLIGATTREALLTAPFRSRFGLTLRFEPYCETALLQILQRNARLLQTEATPEGLARLAGLSRGVPRLANRLLRRCRDTAEVRERPLDDGVVEATLQMLGIDEHGLERLDRRVLQALANAEGRPLGLKLLAATVDEGEDTLEEVVEPWLIRCGYLARTPQGRTLLPAGWRILGKQPRSQAPLLDL